MASNSFLFLSLSLHRQYCLFYSCTTVRRQTIFEHFVQLKVDLPKILLERSRSGEIGLEIFERNSCLNDGFSNPMVYDGLVLTNKSNHNIVILHQASSTTAQQQNRTDQWNVRSESLVLFISRPVTNNTNNNKNHVIQKKVVNLAHDNRKGKKRSIALLGNCPNCFFVLLEKKFKINNKLNNYIHLCMRFGEAVAQSVAKAKTAKSESVKKASRNSSAFR
ncbi:hypothetical protein T07_14846 [Trichinella nelsoni]|uniref:Uncharacterized protein n=1 Tax=Trichinella nelsoni TaxID=6336 RepID=A0A0V0RVD9_9BILA|nr:hypothetical protein T07_14846 [Trichinella nelsoni]